MNEIDARPFAQWLNERAERLGITQTLAEIGWPNDEAGQRRLYRYRYQRSESMRQGVPVVTAADTFDRDTVLEALWQAGGPALVDELYPGVDAGDHHDAFCDTCHEMVTVGDDGICPWCESPTDAEKRGKLFCERCDRPVFPANDGSCWRCGVRATPLPWRPCACGCGTDIQRFDRHNREIRWVHGHAPRTLERTVEMPVDPFAAYLEQQIADLDVLGAVARLHGIARDEVVRVLNRAGPVDREVVRRALWVASKGGTTGKGAPPKPGSKKLGDLYPDYVLSRTCPTCGGGKAPHAELCKQCRTAANRRAGVAPPVSPTRLSDDVLADAYRIYTEENATVLTCAERVLDRAPSASAGSIAQGLSREWKRRGWPMRDRTVRAA